MSDSRIKQTGLFILLVFLQVVLLNKIHLFGYAVPLLYIYFILVFPVNANRNVVLIFSAVMGLTLDLFSYTLGLNLLACTVAGFFRHYLLKLFTPKDIFSSDIPSIRSFGRTLYFRYLSSMVLLHQIVLFTAESVSLFDPLRLFFRILGSSVLTIIILYAYENINFGDYRK